MKTFIPFDGFYCSVHDARFDSWLEGEAEYYGLENVDDIFEKCDWEKARFYYSRDYVAGFTDYFDIDLELEFIELISPREYNFTTDQILCEIPQHVATIAAPLGNGGLFYLTRYTGTTTTGNQINHP